MQNKNETWTCTIVWHTNWQDELEMEKSGMADVHSYLSFIDIECSKCLAMFAIVQLAWTTCAKNHMKPTQLK